MSRSRNRATNRRRHDRSGDKAKAPVTAPAARHAARHAPTLKDAVRRGPGDRCRAEAFAAYVRALPAEVDSIGAIRAHFAEDLHVLFEALLTERPGSAPRGRGRPESLAGRGRRARGARRLRPSPHPDGRVFWAHAGADPTRDVEKPGGHRGAARRRPYRA